MTAATAPGQAGATTIGPAGPGPAGEGRSPSLIKNNQVRPVRRAIHWYNVEGQIHDVKVLHRAQQTVKPEKH